MSSSVGGGGAQQFRYTQTPSKVLHLRNLPWECAEEELVELCNPFGRIVNTKCGVGANRNQAFVEFTDINQAISMVSYFASSSEPAQIRGKTVYIQYSNRQEIVNNKSPGETAGNVLLVTIEGVQANDVTIDVIHLVFSAFGFVHKIATFEKAAGFQALIQYTDAATASAAREALDGRSIPRDYTNPYLPVNSSAIDTLQPAVGADGRKVEAEGNVLLASIENMQYAVTVDVLHTVFSAFGTVQKIAIFEKNGGTQALIQYPDVTTASVAKEALEGHCIYDVTRAGITQSLKVRCKQYHNRLVYQQHLLGGKVIHKPVVHMHHLELLLQTTAQQGKCQIGIPGTLGMLQLQEHIQYGASGGFSAPAAPPQELHTSQQMPPPQYGNQPGPAGAPGTGQPHPYYR
uniref:RRM domain-containing protein n=1 Tax=Oryza meridionalis TaxID=40149 RepID=A0A0E0D1D0_9ORYZ